MMNISNILKRKMGLNRGYWYLKYAPKNKVLFLSVCLNLTFVYSLFLLFSFPDTISTLKEIFRLGNLEVYSSERVNNEIYTDKNEFLQRIYGTSKEWDVEEQFIVKTPANYAFQLWKKHTSGGTPVGYIPFNNNRVLEILNAIPNTSQDTDGIIELFQWYKSRKWNELYTSFEAIIGNDVHPNNIFCNQAVSMFRTILQEKGFISRPVVFEYSDGHGRGSHTFMEVFAPEQEKWLYFDPHFYAYSPQYSVKELLNHPEKVLFSPLPPTLLTKTFQKNNTSLSNCFYKDGIFGMSKMA